MKGSASVRWEVKREEAASVAEYNYHQRGTTLRMLPKRTRKRATRARERADRKRAREDGEDGRVHGERETRRGASRPPPLPKSADV